jgi:hypothetical protein
MPSVDGPSTEFRDRTERLLNAEWELAIDHLHPDHSPARRRRWVYGSIFTMAAAGLVGLLMFTSSRPQDQVPTPVGQSTIDLQSAELFQHRPGDYPATKTEYDLRDRFGSPNRDSGWQTLPSAEFGTPPRLCPGHEVRALVWTGLTVWFERPEAAPNAVDRMLSERVLGWTVNAPSIESARSADQDGTVKLISKEGIGVGTDRATVNDIVAISDGDDSTAIEDGDSTVTINFAGDQVSVINAFAHGCQPAVE